MVGWTGDPLNNPVDLRNILGDIDLSQYWADAVVEEEDIGTLMNTGLGRSHYYSGAFAVAAAWRILTAQMVPDEDVIEYLIEEDFLESSRSEADAVFKIIAKGLELGYLG